MAEQGKKVSLKCPQMRLLESKGNYYLNGKWEKMDQDESRQKQYPRDYQYREDEINLIDYLRVIWKWKVFIVLMVVLCAGVGVGATMVKYPIKYVTECIILLNFSGIDKHQNPDGILFGKNQVIAPTILSRATAFLRKGNKDLPSEDIRGMIGIKAIIPPEIQEKMKKALKRKESYTFFPNKFSLTLTAEREGIFLKEEKDQILLSIIDEYRKEFERRYGEEPLIAISFPSNFLANCDYIETVDIFKMRTNNFVKFLDSKIEKAGFFRSKKTGLTFADIKNDIELLRTIELLKAEISIKVLGLTKNKEHFISKYKHKIKKIEIQRRKKEEEASVALKLLKEMRQPDSYKLSKGTDSEKGTMEARLVLDSSFIENLIKNDYYSSLLKTALKAAVEAKNLEIDKKFLEEKMAVLKEKENIPYIQKSLKAIQDRISFLAQRANELKVEYLRGLVDGAVQVIKYPETFKTRSGNLKRTGLLAGVVGLFFAIFLAFFIEYIKNASKKTEA